jgi:hypothetical protein
MNKIIIGEDDKGDFRLTISDTARITYGPNVPFSAKGEDKFAGRTSGYALRVYEKDDLLAVLTNVKWFREQSIKIARVVERVVSSTVYKDEDNGAYTTEQSTVTSRQLVEGDPILDTTAEVTTNNNNAGKTKKRK